MSRALAKAISRDVGAFKVGVPWDALSKIEPLRGNLIDVLGSPGAGKSAFALNWCLNIDTPSIIISLDTDLTTQAIRTASILGGQTMEQVMADLKKWGPFLDKAAYRLRVYDQGFSPREIMDIIQAEEEFWGEPPALVVVDNISNLVKDGGYEEYHKVFVDLHRISRATNTCILALHHIGRESAKRTAGATKFSVPPISLWSGQYSGEQESEIVLGLWREGYDAMNVSILKNRSGEADPNGDLYTQLVFDRPKMVVRDMTEEEVKLTNWAKAQGSGEL